jgi:hypothetical protein
MVAMEKEADFDKEFNPVRSHFYDELAAAVAARQPYRLVYRDDEGGEQEIAGLINDVYTDLRVEYVRLSNQKVIPLDQVIHIENVAVSGRT